MNRCFECSFRGELEESKVPHLLDGLFEVTAIQTTCPECGAQYIGFDRMEPMYDAIARDLAVEPRRLSPEETRWLRKYLGFSSDTLAEYLGVTRQTVSRWENDGGVPLATERLLRFMAKQGPAVDDYPLEERTRELPRFQQNSRGDWVRV